MRSAVQAVLCLSLSTRLFATGVISLNSDQRRVYRSISRDDESLKDCIVKSIDDCSSNECLALGKVCLPRYSGNVNLSEELLGDVMDLQNEAAAIKSCALKTTCEGDCFVCGVACVNQRDKTGNEITFTGACNGFEIIESVRQGFFARRGRYYDCAKKSGGCGSECKAAAKLGGGKLLCVPNALDGAHLELFVSRFHLADAGEASLYLSCFDSPSSDDCLAYGARVDWGQLEAEDKTTQLTTTDATTLQSDTELLEQFAVHNDAFVTCSFQDKCIKPCLAAGKACVPQHLEGFELSFISLFKTADDEGAQLYASCLNSATFDSLKCFECGDRIGLPHTDSQDMGACIGKAEVDKVLQHVSEHAGNYLDCSAASCEVPTETCVKAGLVCLPSSIEQSMQAKLVALFKLNTQEGKIAYQKCLLTNEITAGCTGGTGNAIQLPTLDKRDMTAFKDESFDSLMQHFSEHSEIYVECNKDPKCAALCVKGGTACIPGDLEGKLRQKMVELFKLNRGGTGKFSECLMKSSADGCVSCNDSIGLPTVNGKDMTACKEVHFREILRHFSEFPKLYLECATVDCIKAFKKCDVLDKGCVPKSLDQALRPKFSSLFNLNSRLDAAKFSSCLKNNERPGCYACGGVIGLPSVGLHDFSGCQEKPALTKLLTHFGENTQVYLDCAESNCEQPTKTCIAGGETCLPISLDESLRVDFVEHFKLNSAELYRTCLKDNKASGCVKCQGNVGLPSLPNHDLRPCKDWAFVGALIHFSKKYQEYIICARLEQCSDAPLLCTAVGRACIPLSLKGPKRTRFVDSFKLREIASFSHYKQCLMTHTATGCVKCGEIIGLPLLIGRHSDECAIIATPAPKVAAEVLSTTSKALPKNTVHLSASCGVVPVLLLLLQ